MNRCLKVLSGATALISLLGSRASGMLSQVKPSLSQAVAGNIGGYGRGFSSGSQEEISRTITPLVGNSQSAFPWAEKAYQKESPLRQRLKSENQRLFTEARIAAFQKILQGYDELNKYTKNKNKTGCYKKEFIDCFYNRAELFGFEKISAGEASGGDATLACSARAHLALYNRAYPALDFNSMSDELVLLAYWVFSSDWSALDTEIISFNSSGPIAFIKDVFTRSDVWPMEISFRKVKNLTKILSPIYYYLWGAEKGKKLSAEKLAKLHQYTLKAIQDQTDLYKILESQCKSAQELNRLVNMSLATAFWNCSLSLKTMTQYYIDHITVPQEISEPGQVDLAKLIVQRAAPSYPFFTYMLLCHLDELLELRAEYQKEILQKRKESIREEVQFLYQNGINIMDQATIPTMFK